MSLLSVCPLVVVVRVLLHNLEDTTNSVYVILFEEFLWLSVSGDDANKTGGQERGKGEDLVFHATCRQNAVQQSSVGQLGRQLSQCVNLWQQLWEIHWKVWILTHRRRSFFQFLSPKKDHSFFFPVFTPTGWWERVNAIRPHMSIRYPFLAFLHFLPLLFSCQPFSSLLLFFNIQVSSTYCDRASPPATFWRNERSIQRPECYGVLRGQHQNERC